MDKQLVRVAHVEYDSKGVYVFGTCGHMSKYAPHSDVPECGSVYRCHHCFPTLKNGPYAELPGTARKAFN
jgi:hypothetical protein